MTVSVLAGVGALLRNDVWDNDYVVVDIGSRSLEAPMGSKDKGGKNTKTVAAKNLKEKRLDKKAKRTIAEAKRSRTI